MAFSEETHGGQCQRDTADSNTLLSSYTAAVPVLSQAHGSLGSSDIPRAKLGVIWTLVSAVSVLDEMWHWDCRKAKISLRFVSLLSTCSPQEMSFLWAPHGSRRGIGSVFEHFIGKGNRSIFEPFSQFWPGRNKQQTAGEAQAPLPYSGKMSVYVFLVSGESS